MFLIKNIFVMSYSGGITHWLYKSTQDTLATVQADGYFNEAADMFATGDMITACAPDGRGTNFWVLADRSGGIMRTSRDAGGELPEQKPEPVANDGWQPIETLDGLVRVFLWCPSVQESYIGKKIDRHRFVFDHGEWGELPTLWMPIPKGPK